MRSGKINFAGAGDDAPIRVVEIMGIEKNTCCGTHVPNLSDLQTVKILYTEKLKGITRVWFAAGERVRLWLGKSVQRDRMLTQMLSVAPADFPSSVTKLLAQSRASQKLVKQLMHDLATMAGEQCRKEALARGSGSICHHMVDGGNDFMNAFLKSVAPASAQAQRALAARASATKMMRRQMKKMKTKKKTSKRRKMVEVAQLIRRACHMWCSSR